jgi:hypothetical protein
MMLQIVAARVQNASTLMVPRFQLPWPCSTVLVDLGAARPDDNAAMLKIGEDVTYGACRALEA